MLCLYTSINYFASRQSSSKRFKDTNFDGNFLSLMVKTEIICIMKQVMTKFNNIFLIMCQICAQNKVTLYFCIHSSRVFTAVVFFNTSTHSLDRVGCCLTSLSWAMDPCSRKTTKNTNSTLTIAISHQRPCLWPQNCRTCGRTLDIVNFWCGTRANR